MDENIAGKSHIISPQINSLSFSHRIREKNDSFSIFNDSKDFFQETQLKKSCLFNEQGFIELFETTNKIDSDIPYHSPLKLKKGKDLILNSDANKIESASINVEKQNQISEQDLSFKLNKTQNQFQIRVDSQLNTPMGMAGKKRDSEESQEKDLLDSNVCNKLNWSNNPLPSAKNAIGNRSLRQSNSKRSAFLIKQHFQSKVQMDESAGIEAIINGQTKEIDNNQQDQDEKNNNTNNKQIITTKKEFKNYLAIQKLKYKISMMLQDLSNRRLHSLNQTHYKQVNDLTANFQNTAKYQGTKGETPPETFFTTFCLLLTVGVFAYLISTISTILEEINREHNQFQMDIGVMNKFMNRQKLGLNIQSRVKSFIEYLYQASGERNMNQKANEVLLKLPQSLRNEIFQEINTAYLQQFQFLQNNFTKLTQQQLTEIMEEKQYITNEVIFQQNQTNDISSYLIVKGSVDLIYKGENNKDFIIATYQEGDIIGEHNLITGDRYFFSAKCTCFVTTIKICRQKFIDVLKENSEDFQKYSQIREELLFQDYSRALPKICQICDRMWHSEQNCNLLVYNPNKQTVFLKSQQSVPHLERKKYMRRLQKGHYPLNENLMLYYEEVFEKLQENEDFNDYYDQLCTYSDVSDDSDFDDEELDYDNQRLDDGNNYYNEQQNLNNFCSHHSLSHNNIEQINYGFQGIVPPPPIIYSNSSNNIQPQYDEQFENYNQFLQHQSLFHSDKERGMGSHEGCVRFSNSNVNLIQSIYEVSRENSSSDIHTNSMGSPNQNCRRQGQNFKDCELGSAYKKKAIKQSYRNSSNNISNEEPKKKQYKQSSLKNIKHTSQQPHKSNGSGANLSVYSDTILKSNFSCTQNEEVSDKNTPELNQKPQPSVQQQELQSSISSELSSEQLESRESQVKIQQQVSMNNIPKQQDQHVHQKNQNISTQQSMSQSAQNFQKNAEKQFTINYYAEQHEDEIQEQTESVFKKHASIERVNSNKKGTTHSANTPMSPLKKKKQLKIMFQAEDAIIAENSGSLKQNNTPTDGAITKISNNNNFLLDKKRKQSMRLNRAQQQLILEMIDQEELQSQSPVKAKRNALNQAGKNFKKESNGHMNKLNSRDNLSPLKPQNNIQQFDFSQGESINTNNQHLHHNQYHFHHQNSHQKHKPVEFSRNQQFQQHGGYQGVGNLKLNQPNQQQQQYNSQQQHQQQQQKRLSNNQQFNLQFKGGHAGLNLAIDKKINEFIQENDKLWLFLNLDSQKNWRYYYPQFNLKNLVAKYKQLTARKSSKDKKLSLYQQQFSKQPLKKSSSLTNRLKQDSVVTSNFNQDNN